MRGFVLLVLWVLGLQVQLVAQEWEWAKSAGKDGNIMVIDKIVPYGDLGYIVAGNAYGDIVFNDVLYESGNDWKFFYGLVDKAGELIWIKTGYFQSTYGFINGLELIDLKTVNNDIFLALNFPSGIIRLDDYDITTNKTIDVLILKINEGREIEWVWQTDSTNGDNIRITSIEVDSDGNIYGCLDAYKYFSVIKISKEGEELWQRIGSLKNILGGPGGFTMNKMKKDNYNTIWVCGSFIGDVEIGTWQYNTNDSLVSFLFNINSDGSFINIHADGSQYDALDILPYEKGVYVFYPIDPNYEDSTNVNYGIHVKKLKSDFSIERETDINGLSLYGILITFTNSRAFNIDVDPNGNLYIAGFHLGGQLHDSTILIPNKYEGIVCNSPLILKYDPQLNLQHYLLIPGELSDRVTSFVVTEPDNIVITGEYQSNQLNFGYTNLYNNDSIKPFISFHGVLLSYYRLPKSFLAEYNFSTITNHQQYLGSVPFLYPNPTNNTLNLQSESFAGQPVQVQIFSTDGRLVRQQNISGAMQTIQVQTDDLPPGMYVATTIVNQQISSARFIKQ